MSQIKPFKDFFNYKISCISTSFRKAFKHYKSYSQKVTGLAIFAELPFRKSSKQFDYILKSVLVVDF